MKRTVIAVLTAILALVMVAAPATASTRTTPADGLPPVLKVGTEGVYSPFSYHDSNGRLTGFDIDVMDAIGKKLGVKI